jgi:transcriptional regulator with XRE-family HTH domain
MTTAIPVHRRLIGSTLRHYRESLGLVLDDSASYLECDKSKVSRIETGQRGITPRELRDLLTEYGAPAPVVTALAALARGAGCWPVYRDIISGPFADYLTLELAATEIAVYQPDRIPDLLQVPAYTRAFTPTDGYEQRVKLTLDRQHVILGKQQSALTAVIGEHALNAADDDIRRDQARHLAATTAASRHVSVQVLRDEEVARACGSGPVTIFRFAGTTTAVYVATLSGGAFLTADSDTSAYADAFARLQQAALSQDQTRDPLHTISRA